MYDNIINLFTIILLTKINYNIILLSCGEINSTERVYK